jgi:Skp family chaperone for outer membrane proteins
MKVKSILLLVLLLILAASGYAQEQAPATAAESLEKLRAQLLDVQAKEQELRDRAQQLEESLKPENIERSLAGVGSTRPEELREYRRRQLTKERDGVLAQLKVVETSRQRLETAILNAQGRAYQESARPTPVDQLQLVTVSSVWGYRWLMFGGGGVAALALAGGVLFYRRKIRLR